MTGIGVERIVKWFDLLPQAFHLGGKSVRLHVVLAAPHRPRIFEAHLLRAFITQLNKANIVLANRLCYLMPPKPCSLRAIVDSGFYTQIVKNFQFVV